MDNKTLDRANAIKKELKVLKDIEVPGAGYNILTSVTFVMSGSWYSANLDLREANFPSEQVREFLAQLIDERVAALEKEFSEL